MIKRAVSGNQREDFRRRIQNQQFYWPENKWTTFKPTAIMFLSSHKMLTEVFKTSKMSSGCPYAGPCCYWCNLEGDSTRLTFTGSVWAALLSTEKTPQRPDWHLPERTETNTSKPGIMFFRKKESKIKLFGQNRRHVWCKLNTVFYSRNRSS